MGGNDSSGKLPHTAQLSVIFFRDAPDGLGIASKTLDISRATVTEMLPSSATSKTL